MADRLTQLKEFVQRERQVINSFNDPDNIKAHKWYVKKSVDAMKGDMLRDIDSMLRDKRTTLMRQYNNHNDELRREITELENERKEIYNYRFNDGAIMKDNQYKKIKAFLAQEFKDVKAMLKKKNFKDFIVSNTSVGDFDVFISNNGGTLGYIIKKKGSNNTIEERFGFSNSAEAMTAGKEAVSKLNKDAKIKDAGSSEYEGMDLGEMKQLRSELMRKQERERAGSDKFHEYQKQISELTRYINRFKDDKISDARIELKMGGRTIGYIEADTLSEAVRRYEEEHPEARGKVAAYMADKKHKIDDADINDSLSEKAKQLISKAVSEARFDYKTAMDFAVADLKAEKEWAWTNHNEVSQMVQRLIKNRMDF